MLALDESRAASPSAAPSTSTSRHCSVNPRRTDSTTSGSSSTTRIASVVLRRAGRGDDQPEGAAMAESDCGPGSSHRAPGQSRGPVGKPSPTPSWPPRRSRRPTKNRSNRRFRSAAGMPGPSSVTDQHTMAIGKALHATVCAHRRAQSFCALATRFRSARSSRGRSPNTRMPPPRARLSSMVWPR